MSASGLAKTRLEKATGLCPPSSSKCSNTARIAWLEVSVRRTNRIHEVQTDYG